jgi:endo-1,4-beta-xylanase
MNDIKNEFILKKRRHIMYRNDLFYYSVKALLNVLIYFTCLLLFNSKSISQPLASGYNKFIGNVAGGIPDASFEKYWNQVTPENSSKWGSVEGTRDVYNWSACDQAYDYAKSKGFPFKFHCLIWGQQSANWLSSLPVAVQLEEIEEWFSLVGKRYPAIDYIDVVNEPLNGHNPPDGGGGRANYKAALGGNGTTGWDWVIKSFELARQYIPQAKLILNDYGIINDNVATTTYLTIINLLKQRNLIDGIGVQGHQFELVNAASNTLKGNLDRLWATGIPIYISELDLGPTSGTTPNEDSQLSVYKRVFPILFEHPGVKGITFWGYIQGRMWQTNTYILRSDGTETPALQWLRNYLSSGNYRSFQSGNWNDLNTWEKNNGTDWIHPVSTIPVITDKSIFIASGHTVSVTGNESAKLLTISSDGKLIIDPGASLQVSDLIIDNQAEITLSGNATISNSLELKNGNIAASTFSFQYSDTASLIYSGKSMQTSSDIEFPSTLGPDNLEIRNTAGVTLHNTRKITGNLLIAGKLKIVDNDLIVASANNTTSSRYVVADGLGELKQYCSGSVEAYFPVGTNYFAPVWVLNTGIGDTISINVANDGNPAAFGGRVKIKWNINESVSGSGNYMIKFGWTGSAEDAVFRADRAANAKIFNLTDTSEAGSGQYTSDFTNLPYTVMRSGIEELGSFGIGKFRDITDVGENIIIPKKFELFQNYPNPFNPSTAINYFIPKSSNIKIVIYNMLGVKVRTLIDNYQTAGNHTTVWDSKDDYYNSVASGIYFYQLESGDINIQKKMILIK